jgi:hypothetical protein
MKLLSLKSIILAVLVLAGLVRAQEIDLNGRAGWTKSGSRLIIRAEQIHNFRESGKSGPLRLQIWATVDPYDGSNDITGYVVGTARLNALEGGDDKFNVSKRVAYHRPPPGYYFTTITLEERYPDGTWLVHDSENFEGVVNFGGYSEGAVYDLQLSTSADISFAGDLTWLSGDGKVQMFAEEIRNLRSSGRSGSLRVRLFASEGPYTPGETFYAYPLATKSAGRIYAGAQIFFYPGRVKFTPPPSGEWLITYTLEEYDHGWVIQDYYTFEFPRLF